MKNTFGVLAVLMCFQLGAQNQKADFWVIGSFTELVNAVSEKDRLRSETGWPVEVATSASGGKTVYRLLVARDGSAGQKQELVDGGFEPWVLTIDVKLVGMSPGELGRVQVRSEGTQYYLVLAGFRDEPNAKKFWISLAEGGVRKVQIDTSLLAGAPWYRILHGPFSSTDTGVKNGFNSRGISDAWWLRVESGTELVMVRESVPEEVVEPVVVAIAPPVEVTPRLIPPQSGESYITYCTRKANEGERAIYCNDSSVKGILAAEQWIRDGRSKKRGQGKDHVAFCALKASAIERQKYCSG